MVEQQQLSFSWSTPLWRECLNYIENPSPWLSTGKWHVGHRSRNTAGLYSVAFHSLCAGAKPCFMKVSGYRQDQRLPLEGGQLSALSKVWVPTSRLGYWEPGPHDMGRMARAMGGSKWTHRYLCAHACIHIWPFQICKPSPFQRWPASWTVSQLPLGVHVTDNSGPLSFGTEGSQILTAPRNQVLLVWGPRERPEPQHCGQFWGMSFAAGKTPLTLISFLSMSKPHMQRDLICLSCNIVSLIKELIWVLSEKLYHKGRN